MSIKEEKKKKANIEYQLKNKAVIKAKRKRRYEEEKAGIRIPVRKPKVMVGMLTRPQSAVYLGLSTQKLSNIVAFKKYWGLTEHLDPKGKVYFKIKDLDVWKTNNPQYFDEWSRVKKAYYTMSGNVMLITEWLQASKAVTKYCNKQRFEIESKKLWARWG